MQGYDAPTKTSHHTPLRAADVAQGEPLSPWASILLRRGIALALCA